VAQALLEAHYSLHGAFLLDAPLLDHVDRIRAAGIPCIAVQVGAVLWGPGRGGAMHALGCSTLRHTDAAKRAPAPLFCHRLR
jgi:hypothetical protein